MGNCNICKRGTPIKLCFHELELGGKWIVLRVNGCANDIL